MAGLGNRWRAGRRAGVPTIMQQESVECGATCLAMVLAYYGRWVSPEELRELCGVSRDGTQSSSILRAARSFGLIAKGFSKTTADLANLPLPMILFWNFNHFVVLESISEKGAWINDPATGPRRVSMEEVDTAFTGVVLAFQPTEAFTPGGSRASLFSVIAANLATVKTGIIFAVLAGIGLLVPGIFTAGSYRIFTDEILVSGRSTWLAPLLVGLGIAALLAGALTWMQRQAQSRTETALGASIAVRYLWTLLGLPLSFFGQRYSGDIVNRLTQADRMASLIATGLVPALIGLVPILGFGAALFLLDWVLASIVVSVALVALLILSRAARSLENENRRSLNDEARLHGITLQGLSMRDDFRAAGTEALFMRRWQGAQAQVLGAEQRIAERSGLINETAALLLALAGIAVLIVGGVRIMDGALSIGLLVAAQALIGRFTGPMINLVGVGARLQSIRGISDRLNDALNYAERHAKPLPGGAETAAARLAALKTAEPLRLTDVSFSYNPRGAPALERLSLSVPVGGRIGLVGASGSGKSTLGRLIVGLVAPSEGQVEIFGHPLTDWPETQLRSQVAYVDQHIGLFGGTIRDNLTLWDESVPEEQYVAAAQDARIHDFISSRPGGYASVLMENGNNLSGGERQRLALARALTINPRILVLDEATSALDPVTEAAVMEAIRRRGCTCIVIAHRLSSIMDSDMILVMDKGRVVETGSHQALITKGGLYAALVEN
ncbi:hypothetical protein VZ95_08225 [Elstera litoralis]|uniref:ABC transporter n=1 Tax=Elstera litoralis TaxID=552518 RepID=A0A0F3ITJ8_9PROT|nr:hypothetical protein VZ95_08225 [Elstera litoralis]